MMLETQPEAEMALPKSAIRAQFGDQVLSGLVEGLRDIAPGVLGGVDGRGVPGDPFERLVEELEVLDEETHPRHDALLEGVRDEGEQVERGHGPVERVFEAGVGLEQRLGAPERAGTGELPPVGRRFVGVDDEVVHEPPPPSSVLPSVKPEPTWGSRSRTGAMRSRSPAGRTTPSTP
jgi:hypothetical protein